MELGAIERAVASRLPGGLAMLESWVLTNSFTKNREGVEAMGEMTAAAFAPLGFSAGRVPSVLGGCGRHVFLWRGGSSDLTLMLVSHLDTVYPAAEEAREGFRWRREGDRIYGPGVLDIKGGTLVMWLALWALAEAAPAAFALPNWVLAFDATEEVLSADFGALCRERLGAGPAAALVFESGLMDGSRHRLVTSRKGRITFRATAEGRAAHAGSGHGSGANAIQALAEFIRDASSLTDYGRGLTVNVGVVEGGEGVNRVPRRASAELEVRAEDPAVLAEAAARVRAWDGRVLSGAVGLGAGCTMRVKPLGEVAAWPENAGTRSLLDILRRAGEDIGLQIEGSARGGLSDANFLWDAAPTIDGLGACGGGAHCPHWGADGSPPEHVEAGSLSTKTRLVAAALARIIRDPSGLA